MISRLNGTLLFRDTDRIELETSGGVVYEVDVPLIVLQRLPAPGAELQLRTLQVVTDTSVTLYGFIEAHERTLFQRLLTANGVGAKLALAMMSTYSRSSREPGLLSGIVARVYSNREASDLPSQPRRNLARARGGVDRISGSSGAPFNLRP